MLTLNQVVKNQSDFASAHQQINHFFFGEEWDFASSGVVNTPAMISVLQPATVTGSTLTHTFKVYFGDIVHKDLSNKSEVLSDMMQVALDFIYQFQHPDYEWVFDTSNLVLNDFEDSFDCELYGYWLTCRLKLSSPFDRCAIPQTPASITASGCPVVTIRNSDGTVSTTVAAGGTYTLSAVSGGGTYEIYVNGTLNQSGSSSDFTTETFNIQPG